MSPLLLRAAGITKSFGPVRVLEDVSFDLRRGEIHVLAGENGAGKSTLIKILAGVHTDWEGTVELMGRGVRFDGPLAANRHGVAVIHQELSMIETMSVVDNVFLGHEITRGRGAFLDQRAQLARARSLCARLGMQLSDADLRRPIAEFPLSLKNRVEIAKALACEAQVLIMDEPTSALDRTEVEAFFQVIEALKRDGCGIIYISHKMEEIYRLADRITVLRDGRLVGTAAAADCPEPVLVRWMIGRELTEQIPVRPGTGLGRTGPARLEVEGLVVRHPDPARPPVVKGLSFAVRPGEVLGLAGLQGSGCSEVLSALFGAGGDVAGASMALDGAPYAPTCPADAIRAGVAWLTAERKRTGLVLDLPVAANISLASVPRISPGGWLRSGLERARAEALCRSLRIRLHSPLQPVGVLSGGNQQKVVLAKWLETRPRLLLLEEPTRGVDVGAKHEIYALMHSWAASGMAIVLLSSEMPEVLRLSDRILVLHRGEAGALLERDEATPERILAAAMGVGNRSAA